MKRQVSPLPELLLLRLTPAGRERLRRLHATETDALVTARRMQVLQLLTGIGQCHVGLAELACRQATAAQPELAPQARRIVEALSTAITNELIRFARGREGAL